jgi:2-iminobutanoate/2-iminopropanoate deaminase
MSQSTNTSARRSIDVAGAGHGAVPIPAASRIANVVMTGAVYGRDPGASNAIPEGDARQVALMFANLAALLAAAGAKPEHVIKLSISAKDLGIREAINVEWLKMFPDAASRPARHLSQYDHFPGTAVISCEAYAVIT